jgi:hypothetical protein
MYAKLEEWLGRKVDENWDTHFDNLELVWIMILFTLKYIIRYALLLMHTGP